MTVKLLERKQNFITEIIALIIAAAIVGALVGCSSKGIVSSTLPPTTLSTNNSTSEPSTETKATTPSTENTTAAPSTDNPKITTPSTDNSITTDESMNKPFVYTNESLGFQITFPASWNGNCLIEEDWNGIHVSYLPQSMRKPIIIRDLGYGRLFSIIDKGSLDEESEDHFDTVSEIRYFEAKGRTYVIGGPTDVQWDTEAPDWNVFYKMYDEEDGVIKTLKILE